ncbi:MAG TPA: complex I subunit 5 family protein [Acidimicrobiales bacterium]|nr:complex I subunit 5 family protein [Acidimicrobiales bacterium]
MPVFDTGVAWLPPVALTIPILLSAAVLVGYRRVRRPVVDAVATAGAACVVAVTAALLARSSEGRVVTWSAGWAPSHGFSVGIVLVSDPVGDGIALTAAVLVTLALVFSWRYVESAEGHFHTLVLLFLAGMEGFALTGDLFDMFVFFELMGAAAYALTGMKVEDVGSLQGGMNFGIMNSLGAYMALMGVGFLYARTGNLGLPQLGEVLDHQPRSTLVVAAFVMLMAGFLVKGAMAPFHFWLADAHAVAPAPVCVLFSGVMVPLGVYAAFRVYWVVFSHQLAPGDIRRTFVVMGAVTAVVGSVMCLTSRNFKRLLAYSTIAHVGLFLSALGYLTAAGTAGALLYVAGHAGVKSALFLIGGVMLARYGSVDEIDLHGRGRDTRVMKWLAVAGGLGLACLPPFGTALGKAISEDAGVSAGYPWAPALFVVVSALTGGAVLRATGRIYFGMGPRPEGAERPDQTSGSREERDTRPLRRVPVTMLAPIVVLLLGSLAIGVVPGVHSAAQRAAEFFVDGAAYQRQALLAAPAHVAAAHLPEWTGRGLALDFASAALAVLVAGVGLWGGVLHERLPLARLRRRPLAALRAAHSGHVGDYVAWLLVGLAVLGGFVGLPHR